MTGSVFTGIGAIGMFLNLLLFCKDGCLIKDPTLPWIYSISIMEGVVVGLAATAGAYFGD